MFYRKVLYSEITYRLKEVCNIFQAEKRGWVGMLFHFATELEN